MNDDLQAILDLSRHSDLKKGLDNIASYFKIDDYSGAFEREVLLHQVFYFQRGLMAQHFFNQNPSWTHLRWFTQRLANQNVLNFRQDNFSSEEHIYVLPQKEWDQAVSLDDPWEVRANQMIWPSEHQWPSSPLKSFWYTKGKWETEKTQNIDVELLPFLEKLYLDLLSPATSLSKASMTRL